MDDLAWKGLVQGIREFNDEAFFEAHDTLEDVWMDVRGETRLFFQGLIQLSIGYYHLTCKNYTGADHLLTRGVTKLEAYAPSTCGVTLHPLLEQVKMTLQFVRQTIEGDNPVSFWSYPKIELDLEIWQGIDRKG
jgi:predicted metal-dependent hydrolase